MFTSEATQIMHSVVEWLLEPIIYALIIVGIIALWESGIALGERLGGLNQLSNNINLQRIEQLCRRRIERVDLIARIGPMLGLMGTLIPLGPGLAALGKGDVNTLTTAVTVAFDTTVLGLLIGIIGFILGRLRHRWYDQLLDRYEEG